MSIKWNDVGTLTREAFLQDKYFGKAGVAISSDASPRSIAVNLVKQQAEDVWSGPVRICYSMGRVIAVQEIETEKKKKAGGRWPTSMDANEPMHEFFELSYAQYLVLQRSVIQSMPLPWRIRLRVLLDELDETIDWRRDGYVVRREDEDGDEIEDDLADYQRGRRRIPHLPRREFRNGCYYHDGRLTHVSCDEIDINGKHIIEFRRGNYYHGLNRQTGVPKSHAKIFPDKAAAEAHMDDHPWIYANGGMAVPLATAKN